MKTTAKVKDQTEPKLRTYTRGFPIWVANGQLIDPERQVEAFLRQMFEIIERSGEEVRQANMEVKILTEKK